ncbi:class I SAM-dependent methyltransferase [Halobacillus sp. A1]|uniref:class I SAM-dependent methyltransferase n=1 Tax=Halobacillus sp. A1 TaxID=2880262 RepID=UPI0020A6C8DE|nr:class I SAM-dependent methyltransferase [Halobacillus sp. A1]MCP3029930.1 class I SAM-dependent methyltransferase [Halobacillus sp. A1]
MTERKKLKEIHDYWVKSSTPDLYAQRVERSEFLTKHVKKYVAKKGKVLEVGCNVGRNLNHLFSHGYKDVTGIEISEQAVKAMKKTYPQLAKKANIIHSPVENVIKKLPTDGFDLVFSMAVLEHIHPDSDWILEEIARISGEYLITIEAETAANWRFFPRNYKEIFEKYGFRQVEEKSCEEGGLEHYTLRVFKKKGK